MYIIQEPIIYNSIAAPAAPMMMFASIGAPVTATPAALLELLEEVCAATEPELDPVVDPEEALVPAELLDAADVAADEEESVAVAVVSELVIGDELSPVCAARELTIDE